jgi:hypothetical protein
MPRHLCHHSLSDLHDVSCCSPINVICPGNESDKNNGILLAIVASDCASAMPIDRRSERVEPGYRYGFALLPCCGFRK